jgi:hypothetical protein
MIATFAVLASPRALPTQQRIRNDIQINVTEENNKGKVL